MEENPLTTAARPYVDKLERAAAEGSPSAEDVMRLYSWAVSGDRAAAGLCAAALERWKIERPALTKPEGAE